MYIVRNEIKNISKNKIKIILKTLDKHFKKCYNGIRKIKRYNNMKKRGILARVNEANNWEKVETLIKLLADSGRIEKTRFLSYLLLPRFNR